MATIGRKPTPAAAPSRQAPAPQNIGSAGQQQMSKRQLSREEVAKRAYELWKQRGGSHGNDWEDWLRAERELKGESH